MSSIDRSDELIPMYSKYHCPEETIADLVRKIIVMVGGFPGGRVRSRVTFSIGDDRGEWNGSGAPSKVWEEWAASSFPLPGADFVYQGIDKADRPLEPIAYKSVDLNGAWESFDIQHDLTTKGIQQFVGDHKGTLK